MAVPTFLRTFASVSVAAALTFVGLLAVAPMPSAQATAGPVDLRFLGRHVSGAPDGGSEISAY